MYDRAMRLRTIFGAIGLTAIVGATAGCTHKDETFQSTARVVRGFNAEVDENGKPIVVDVELEWDPCPGDQFQMVRGGPEFAACVQKYKRGELVQAEVKHYWDTRGFYRWDISKLGDCKHEVEEFAEGSYEKSQECADVVDYGKSVGFRCSRRPFKDLVATCPFLARH